MISVREVEAGESLENTKTHQVSKAGGDDQGGINSSSLPDLLTSRPLQLDVGLREVTLKPGVTLEISLQEDLVMTVRVKQESNSRANNNSLETVKNGDWSIENAKSTDHDTISLSHRSKSDVQIKTTLNETVEGLEDAKSLSTNLPLSNTKELDCRASDGTKDEHLVKSIVSHDFEPVDKIPREGECIGLSLNRRDTLDMRNPDIRISRHIDDVCHDQLYSSSSDEEEWTTQNVEESGKTSPNDCVDDEDDWSEIFEDCLDYEESVTDFGCDNYYVVNPRDNHHLHTIIEEEEEDDESTEEEEEEEDQDESESDKSSIEPDVNVFEENILENKIKQEINDSSDDKSSDVVDKLTDSVNYRSDNSVDLDSDTEKSELEQFEILEQLCSSSSDDFDAEEFCKIQQSHMEVEGDISFNVQYDLSPDKERLDKPVKSNLERISSFKDYLKYKGSLKSTDINKKGEYVNKLTLVQENDGRAKVKPVVSTNIAVQERPDDNNQNVPSITIAQTPLTCDEILLTDNQPDKEHTITIIDQTHDIKSIHFIDNKKVDQIKDVSHLSSDSYSDMRSIFEFDREETMNNKVHAFDMNNKESEIDLTIETDRNNRNHTKVGVLKSILRSKIIKDSNSSENMKLNESISKNTNCNAVKSSSDDADHNNDDVLSLKSVVKLKSDSFYNNFSANNNNIKEEKCDNILTENELSKNDEKRYKSILKSNNDKSKIFLLLSGDKDISDLNNSFNYFTDSANSSFDESLMDISNGSNLADISSSSVGLSDNSTLVGDDGGSSELEASFEWHEEDKSMVGREYRETLNRMAGETELRREEAVRRMIPSCRIDPERPQVSIFDSRREGRSQYDFGSDPWFQNVENRCASEDGASPSHSECLMRNKRDGSKLSSQIANSSSAETSSSSDNPVLPKSALKRPGKKRKKHKVQFDESLNKFFEADYVILIREDECECGGELCCSNYLQDDDEEDSFADLDDEESSIVEIPEPPIEFVDQLTLSPPDGYKDTLSDTLGILHQHEAGVGNDEIKSCEDHTTQTTPTSPTLLQPLQSLAQVEEELAEKEFGSRSSCAISAGGNTSSGNSASNTGTGPNSSGDRYIVETITMTTVTERRIVRETLDSSHLTPSREELSLRLVRPCSTTKPGSAVRALFPSAVRSPDSEEETDPLESSLIKRTIERNTLRRSLLKYPGDLRLRRKKQQVPSEESLEEKIRKLTCDIDEDPEPEQRTSPQGQEEAHSNLPQPTYSVSRRLCEVLRKEQHPVALEQQYPSYYDSASFLAATAASGRLTCGDHHRPMSAVDLRPPGDLRLLESRPLSAEPPGTRDSISTDYSLGDIDEVLSDCGRQVGGGPGDGRPDVLAGTPDPPDELALFVEQDASRIERIRKRYSNSEDEGDDYGFSRRPSVRGIKPTFGSTTEILQRMQSQVGPGWSYYPQVGGLNGCRPGSLPGTTSAIRPLCTVQPGTVCQQSAVLASYPQHTGYPATYLSYPSNGYPPRLYPRHDMPPMVRATQTPPHYYSRYRVGSPTKGKLEGRIGPEGAASSSHEPQTRDDTSLQDVQAALRDSHSTLQQNLHDNSSIDSSLMYAMNV